jgi:hypothetical protein
MKKFGEITFILLISLGVVVLGLQTGAGAAENTKTEGKRLNKPMVRGDYVKFDVNNISTFIRNNGSFNRDPGTGNAGFEWPKGTGNTANYASGLWLGGKVGNDVRVAIAEYSYEFDAGPIATGVDPKADRWRVYKIKRGDDATNSTDYANWPFSDGAPALKNSSGTADSLDTSGNKIPALIGDMTIWAVFNDNDPSLHANQHTAQLGVEVQLTAFAYNRSDALGNAIFYRWKIINKGGNRVDSAFVTVWTDIDLGDSGDDYDGCDTTLGLGYTYNGGATDGVYGTKVPATGFDFLQGPLVPGAATDTAKFPDGKRFPGKKLLKMTSFVKYSNDATDLGNPRTGNEVFSYMKGFTRTGAIIPDNNNNPTKFMFPGDPTVASGATNWIETGAAGDRRFMMSAGPFTLAQNDTQEIVAGNLIAQGADYHSSVTALKNADKLVQQAYDLNFKLAAAPSAPTVTARGLNNEVVLSWGEDDSSSTSIETASILDPLAAAGGATKSTYDFQGYVVYQVANASGDDPRIVDTYDVKDAPAVGIIYDDVFDPTIGQFVNKPVKFGSDKGVARTIRITSDKYNSLPLANDKDYYFTVTSYVYNKESVPKTLESSKNVLVVRPTKTPGTRLTAAYGDTAKSITHSAGASEATIVPKVVDASLLTGHLYQIVIDTSGGSKKWKLNDKTLNSTLATSSNFGPGQGGNSYAYPVHQGIQWQVLDVPSESNPTASVFTTDSVWLQSDASLISNSPPAVIDPTKNGGGVVTIGADLSNYLGHMASNFDPSNSVKIEIRFGPAETQKAYRMRRAGGVGTAYVIQQANPFVSIPFTVWDASGATARQLTVAWRDQDNSGTFNPPVAGSGTEVVFIYFRTYNSAGGQWPYMDSTAADKSTFSDVSTVGAQADIMYGMAFGLVAGVTPYRTSKITVVPYEVLKAADVYSITGIAGPTKSPDLSKGDVALIQAVPNPYFGASAYERNQFGRVIRFTNLPVKATIRVFSLSGDLVRIIEKNSASTSTADWDLTNKNNLPVASGMYIVHIDMPEIGATKVLKVAVIMAEERLDNF